MWQQGLRKKGQSPSQACHLTAYPSTTPALIPDQPQIQPLLRFAHGPLLLWLQQHCCIGSNIRQLGSGTCRTVRRKVINVHVKQQKAQTKSNSAVFEIITFAQNLKALNEKQDLSHLLSYGVKACKHWLNATQPKTSFSLK